MPSIRSSAYQKLLEHCELRLRSLDARHLRRRLSIVDSIVGPLVTVGGRRLTGWSSNDYLGLSAHPAVVAAAAAAARVMGVGARASRLLSGTTRCHDDLEKALARWFGAEAAVVFPSGYQANSGILGALLSAEDAVVVDRLAHASLLDAARATRAAFRVFQHNAAAELDKILPRLSKARLRLIVTEGVFSMDGDCAPLAALVKIAERHDALLYVDDAHGAFIAGKTGRGSLQAAGLSPDRVIYMATLGKALGCQGGFFAGPKIAADYLINHSRPFIYATALAPPVAAAACEALRVARCQPQHRRKLLRLARRMHSGLKKMGVSTAARPSHILPVILGDAARALAVSQRLFARGHWAPAIRPPTVAEGTARLRISLTAAHTAPQVDDFLHALQESLNGRRLS